MSHIPDLVRCACEHADNIEELPEQLRASFATGDSAEGRLGFIRSMCNKIRIGLMPVTNYIERNQHHLYREYLRRIELLLGGMQKCATCEIPEYSMPATKRDSPSGGARKNAELAVVAMVLAVWLREWADELRANQGPTQDPKVPTPQDAPPAGNKSKPDGPSLGLRDIPDLEKMSKEWVLVPRALELTGAKSAKVLSNDRIESPARRSNDKCMGIDRRGRMWRKERALSQKVWYYVPSLSYKSS